MNYFRQFVTKTKVHVANFRFLLAVWLMNHFRKKKRERKMERGKHE
jgi:hypothetical protein